MKKRMKKKERKSTGYILRNFILGSQDGIVNVLGTILAVAIATHDSRIVIIAGLGATLAESVSMAAVAYTSTKAERDFYVSQARKERRYIEKIPRIGLKELKDLYYRKGFRGKTLNSIVRTISSDKRLWLRTLMEEGLHLHPESIRKPGRDAWIVGVSAFFGSLIPLMPFFLAAVDTAIPISLMFSAAILFSIGYVKAKLTKNNTLRSGLELAAIGMAAAIAGYLIGAALGMAFYAA